MITTYIYIQYYQSTRNCGPSFTSCFFFCVAVADWLYTPEAPNPKNAWTWFSHQPNSWRSLLQLYFTKTATNMWNLPSRWGHGGIDPCSTRSAGNTRLDSSFNFVMREWYGIELVNHLIYWQKLPLRIIIRYRDVAINHTTWISWRNWMRYVPSDIDDALIVLLSITPFAVDPYHCQQ